MDRRNLIRAAALGAAMLLSPALTVVGPAAAGPSSVLAAPSAAEGYVWASRPASAQYVASTGYEYNSAGAPITITRYAAGSYVVRFGGLGAPGGVAHVSPYGSGNTSICTVPQWSPSGADQLVYVRCFDAGGAPADSRFVAHFTARTATDGEFLTYFRSHWVSGALQTPPATWRYDSYGQPPQLVREGPGRYVVYDDSFDAAAPGVIDGHFQLTAVGSAPVRCWLGDEATEGASPLAYDIYCADEHGDPVDSRFAYTWVRGADVLGADPPAFGNAMVNPNAVLIGSWSTGGQPSAVKLGPGRYRVTFPGLAMPYGYAIAVAVAHPSAFCHVAAWFPLAGNQHVHVECVHTASGRPVDSWFGVAATG